jgi:hypothetical protein
MARSCTQMAAAAVRHKEAHVCYRGKRMLLKGDVHSFANVAMMVSAADTTCLWLPLRAPDRTFMLP